MHGEVTSPEVDVFDRERVFIQTILDPLMHKVPGLKVVLEHITTKDAADFVAKAGDKVAASVTPQHMLLNRNALFQGGLRPHCYCLPVLKREIHREAVAAAATSGSKRFFLGTDSAPHPKYVPKFSPSHPQFTILPTSDTFADPRITKHVPDYTFSRHDRGAKESACGCAGIYSAPIALGLYATAFEQAGALDRLEAFASFHGPDFYGLPRNTDKITLVRRQGDEVEGYKIADEYKFGDSVVVPMWAGQTLAWKVQH